VALGTARILSIARFSSGVTHLVTPAKPAPGREQGAGAYRAMDPSLRRDDEERRPLQLPQSELSRASVFCRFNSLIFDFISLFGGFISLFGQLGNFPSNAS
jgi:hypothetical protein